MTANAAASVRDRDYGVEGDGRKRLLVKAKALARQISKRTRQHTQRRQKWSLVRRSRQRSTGRRVIIEIAGLCQSASKVWGYVMCRLFGLTAGTPGLRRHSGCWRPRFAAGAEPPQRRWHRPGLLQPCGRARARQTTRTGVQRPGIHPRSQAGRVLGLRGARPVGDGRWADDTKAQPFVMNGR